MTSIISAREQDVLLLIAHEFTAKEIGHRLCISHHTAISHRKNLIEKLGARNTAGLVRIGFELGILSINKSEYEHDQVNQIESRVSTDI